MSNRYLDVIIPGEARNQMEELLQNEEAGFWYKFCIDEQRSCYRLLVAENYTEKWMDLLEKHFKSYPAFKIVLLPVEAVLPREEPEAQPEEEKQSNAFIRVSREELYVDMKDGATLSFNFIILMALSTVVAAIGLLQDEIAIVIGAMVIAPLISPQMSLAFGTTLGDFDLLKHSAVNGAVGTAIGIGISLVWGLLDPAVLELESGRGIQLSYVVLALVSGGAGSLAVLRGLNTALVGVMVAVALLPPLVKTGLLLGAARWEPALDSGLLFAANIIGINLAAVVTFLLLGIHPNNWWEAKVAQKQTRWAIGLWLLALVMMVGVIYLLGE